MTYQIIESFMQGKRKNSAYNEDEIVTGKAICGVMDGSHGASTQDVMSAMLDQSKAYLENLDGDQSFEEVEQHLIHLCREIKKEESHSIKSGASYQLAVYNMHREEIWWIGDCQILIGGHLYTTSQPTEKILSDMRAVINKAILLDGATEEELMKQDPSQQMCDRYVEFQKNYANADHPDAYGVINGDAVPERFINTKNIAEHKGDIVFASDGYPDVFATLEETENALQTLLKEDPLMIHKFPQAKGLKADQHSFDDRCYLRVKI